ncbi:branched-chain amino acid ABC transporter permease [Enhydrobacter sp.]|jgi:branched-chain amino acid transport system permease protein|uniref:branched-chain amino acid ABC transporter permease n=1 Tax=Enhydrobacter sp. TaxID=1894999 RepID=UPI00261541EC|nr:branched-chain amino acid ABC transporter permease [Enhydrobacter sp.]WIM11179.1 MAG: high-affinity branched-chain amino acid transport system permease protein LivH [Enhydrobacter sp.]
MLATYLNLVVQGVLLGGLYAIFALGLSLSVGVMRFVNIAHGDFIVLVSFLLLTVATALHINVLLALLLVIPLAFAGGYLLQRILLQRVVGENVLLPLLVTFGLSIIVQNGLLQGFGADTRTLSAGRLDTSSLQIGGLYVGVLPVATFVLAIVLVLGLEWLLYRSRIGAGIRAVADDVAAANLIGLSSARIYAIAMGIVGVTVAIAACFMGLRMNFDPTSGPSRLLVAFEVVVLGGLGSLRGTLLGGIVLGIAQTLGGQIDGAWQVLAGHLVFLAIFLLRPQGLLPRY